MLKNSIEKLMQKQNLSNQTIIDAFDAMLAPDANSLQTAAFLALLRAKTETSEELAAMVAVLQQKMIAVPTEHTVLDIVGTGGDGAQTINISTGSAILAASCGVKIAKHGNRAVSSLAGSADVLEALGIKIDLSPQKINACIDEVGIGFCFSPNFHPALYQLRTLRKTLNIPTSFNLLGPLLNPTQPAHLLLGVFAENLLMPMADTLQKIGAKHSMVVHGQTLDEISCIGPIKVIEITKNTLKELVIDPKTFGFAYCHLSDLQGSDAKTNAKILLDTFANTSTKKNQAISHTLILNAAYALYLYGLHTSIFDALSHAKENLYNGRALTLLKNWIEFSHD